MAEGRYQSIPDANCQNNHFDKVCVGYRAPKFRNANYLQNFQAVLSNMNMGSC